MSRNTSIKVAAVAVGLMLAQPIYAQTVKKLSLQEAVELSLKNSKQLKLSSAKVEEAVAHTRDMWNNHLPDLKVSGSYMRLSNPDVALKVKLPTSSSGQGGEATAGQNITVDQAAYGM